MEVRRLVMEQLGGLDLSWPRPVAHHPVDDLPLHLPVLIQAYADPIDVPWIVLHAGRVLGVTGRHVTPKHLRPLREVYRLAPGTRLALQFYVADRVLEGVWLSRRSLIAQLAQLGFDLVLAPNVSVWRSDSRFCVTWNQNEEDGWGIGPAPWLDASSDPVASAPVGAITLRTVARLTVDASAA